MHGTPRRRLREVELPDGLGGVRAAALALIVMLSMMTVFGFLLGDHRSNGWFDTWTDWHSPAREALLLPIILPLTSAGVALWAVGGRFPRGAIAGLVTIPSGLVVFVVVAFTHLFEAVEESPALAMGTWSQAVATVLGVALIVAEPLCYLVARRALERGDPVFPTARVVRRLHER